MGWNKETWVPFVGGAILGAAGMGVLVVKTIDMHKALEDTVYNWMNHLTGGNKSYSGLGRSHVNYNMYSRSPFTRYPHERYYDKSYIEVKDIVLSTRKEAEDVLDKLFHLITTYASASIADLYTLVGIEGNFDDTKYGWTDIRGVGVLYTDGKGYQIDNLPKAKLLDTYSSSDSKSKETP